MAASGMKGDSNPSPTTHPGVGHHLARRATESTPYLTNAAFYGEHAPPSQVTRFYGLINFE